MKKLLSLLLALTCIVAVTACNKDEVKQKKNKVNPAKDEYELAVWDDYDKIPFMDLLKKGYNAQIENDSEDITFDNLYYEKGWDESENLDESDLSKGSEAVTYFVEMTNNSRNQFGAYYFFMELDGNTLKDVGVKIIIGEDEFEFDEDRIEDILNELVYLIDGSNETEPEKTYSDDLVWENYEDSSFIDFLYSGLGFVEFDEGADISFNHVYRIDGWEESDSLGNDSATKGYTQFTYVADLCDDSTDEDVTYFFFMESDGSILKAVGSKYVLNGEHHNLNKTETENIFNNIVKFLE